MSHPITQYKYEDAEIEEIPCEDALRLTRDLFNLDLRGVRASLISLDICDTLACCKYVFSERLGRAARLLEKFQRSGLVPFQAIYLKFSDGNKQFVPPPVVEIRSDQIVVCDGMHRVYQSLMTGLRSIDCIALSNLDCPLAGVPRPWMEVQVLETQIPVEDNFECFRPEFLSGYTFRSKDLRSVMHKATDVN